MRYDKNKKKHSIYTISVWYMRHIYNLHVLNGHSHTKSNERTFNGKTVSVKFLIFYPQGKCIYINIQRIYCMYEKLDTFFWYIHKAEVLTCVRLYGRLFMYPLQKVNIEQKNGCTTSKIANCFDCMTRFVSQTHTLTQNDNV